jgi:hypothetical protein
LMAADEFVHLAETENLLSSLAMQQVSLSFFQWS